MNYLCLAIKHVNFTDDDGNMARGMARQ